MSIHLEWPVSGIAVVTIDAPGTKNALTQAMLVDLAKAFSALRANKETAVVILTGAGSENFCAGIDLKHAHFVFKMDELDMHNDPVYQMEHCEFPIIGAIRGHAINAGFELALACDMLLCAPCAQFRDTHVALGLVPSWGLSSKLSLIVGPGAAKRAHFACRPIGADEARRVGLVLDVIDEPAGIEPGSAGSQGGDTSSQRVTSHTDSSAQLGTNKFADDALMAAALALALEMTKNQKESVARIKNRIVDGYSLSFGESRTLERRVAFAQYRALPPAFFKKMKAAAGLKPSAKL